MIYVLYLSEEPTGHECFAALIQDPGRIREMSRARRREGLHLEWEEIHLNESELSEAGTGSLIHLVFLGRLTPEDGIRFVFPGQSLALVTVDGGRARRELKRERAIHGEDFVQLWSVPLGWEIPGLRGFLEHGPDQPRRA